MEFDGSSLSSWADYKGYIIGAILLCLAETLLIFGLLWQRAKRRKVEASLFERLTFESLLSDLSTTFINLSEEQVDANIENSLTRVLEFLRLDRITLFEFSADGAGMKVTSSWTTEGIQPPPLNLRASQWPWWGTRAQRGETVLCSAPDELPEEASSEKAYLLESGIQSIASVPLEVGGRIIGAITLVAKQRRVDWTEDLVKQLRVLAELFSNALERKRNTQALLISVAELKRSESVLRESEERLRLAVQAGKMFAYEWDAATDEIVRSAESAKILGIDDASVLTGEQSVAKVHADDRDRLMASIAELSPANPYLGISYRMARPDGSVIWVERNSRAHFDEQGKILRIVGIIADITERKRAELALRESEERFRLVANTAPVMIWMSGTDKLCSYFNTPWLAFTGRSMASEIGNGWVEGVHPEDFKTCMDTYLRAFDLRQEFTMEYRLRRHDGEYRWLHDVGVPRFNADHSFAGYIGSCLDVSERKLAEAAISGVSRKLIEAQEQERSRIARELHDDINQRLALVAIGLEQVEQLGHSPTKLGSEISNKIHELEARVSEIGTEVQAISHRLHSSKLEYLGIVSAARSFCKEFSEQHSVEIEFTHGDISRAVSREISLSVFRVLQEALQNAVKHSGARHIAVRLRDWPEAIQLTVHDSGSGFVVEEAMKTCGLGLISMVERMRLVDGQLSIESQPGRGTTIHARAPLGKAARASA